MLQLCLLAVQAPSALVHLSLHLYSTRHHYSTLNNSWNTWHEHHSNAYLSTLLHFFRPLTTPDGICANSQGGSNTRTFQCRVRRVCVITDLWQPVTVITVLNGGKKKEPETVKYSGMMSLINLYVLPLHLGYNCWFQQAAGYVCSQ